MKEITTRLGRKKTIPETGIGFSVPDPRIEDGDRTHCHVCGREVSVKWNFCPCCGNEVNSTSREERQAQAVDEIVSIIADALEKGFRAADDDTLPASPS